jgi:hypothetical protein
MEVGQGPNVGCSAKGKKKKTRVGNTRITYELQRGVQIASDEDYVTCDKENEEDVLTYVHVSTIC